MATDKARPLDVSCDDSGQNQESEVVRRTTSISSPSRSSFHPEGKEVHLNCHKCGSTLAKTLDVISVADLKAEGVTLEPEQEEGRDVEICLTDVHVYCLPVKTFYDPDDKCKRDIVFVKKNCDVRVYQERKTRTKLMWFQHYVRSKCYCKFCKKQVGSVYMPKDESSNLPTFYGLVLEKLDGKHQEELYLKCRRCQHRVSWRNSIVNLRDHVSIGSGFHGSEDIHLFKERDHTQVHCFKDPKNDYHVFLTVEDADTEYRKKNKVKSDWFVGFTAVECRCPRDWCKRLVGWRFQNGGRHFYGLLVKELHGPHLKAWLWCESCRNNLFQLEDIVPKDPVSSKVVYKESAIVGRVFGFRVPLLKDEHGTLRKILTVTGDKLMGNRGDPLKAVDGWFKDYTEFCPVYCSNCQETIGREYKSTKKDAVVFWEKIGGQFTIPTGLRSPPYSHVKDRTAIVVGNTYVSDPDTRNKLICCANDADAMTRKLKSLRFPFEVCILKNATKEQIISALKNIPTEKDQVVLFYFSGHGTAEKGFHFIVPDSDDRRHWEEATTTSSYINIREIETLMMKTGARVKISIIDACRGTGQFHDRVSENFRKAVEDLSLGNLDDDDVFEDAPESSTIPKMSSTSCPPCAAGSVNPSGTPIAETGTRGAQVEDCDDEVENSTQSTFGSRAATSSVETSSEQDGRDFRRLNESHQGYGFVKMYSCADDTLSSAGDRTSLSYFTKHLVSEMTKELSIYRLFQHVNTMMKSDAGRLKQVPRVHSTLTEPFRFQTRDLPDFSYLPANRD